MWEQLTEVRNVASDTVLRRDRPDDGEEDRQGRPDESEDEATEGSDMVPRSLVDKVCRETKDDGGEDPLRNAEDEVEDACKQHTGGR
jgi:hypothetical protein